MNKILKKQLYYRIKNYENYDSIKPDYLSSRYQPLLPIFVKEETNGQDVKYIELITGREIPIISIDLKKINQFNLEEKNKERINSSSYGIMINKSSYNLSKIDLERIKEYLKDPLKNIRVSNVKNYFLSNGEKDLASKLEQLDKYDHIQLFKVIIDKYLELELCKKEDNRRQFRKIKSTKR